MHVYSEPSDLFRHYLFFTALARSSPGHTADCNAGTLCRTGAMTSGQGFGMTSPPTGTPARRAWRNVTVTIVLMLTAFASGAGAQALQKRSGCRVGESTERAIVADGHRIFGLPTDAVALADGVFIRSWPMVSYKGRESPQIIAGALLRANTAAVRVAAPAPDSGMTLARAVTIREPGIAIVAPHGLALKGASVPSAVRADTVDIFSVTPSGALRRLRSVPLGHLTTWRDAAVSNMVIANGQLILANAEPSGRVPTRLVIHMIGQASARSIEVLGTSAAFSAPQLALRGDKLLLVYRAMLPRVGRIGLRAMLVPLSSDSTRVAAVDLDTLADAESLGDPVSLRDIGHRATELAWLHTTASGTVMHRLRLGPDLSVSNATQTEIPVRGNVRLLGIDRRVNQDRYFIAGQEGPTTVVVSVTPGRTGGLTRTLFEGETIDLPLLLPLTSSRIVLLLARRPKPNELPFLSTLSIETEC